MFEKIALILIGAALSSGSTWYWRQWSSLLKKGTHANGRIVGYERAMAHDKALWFPIVEFVKSDGDHVKRQCTVGSKKQAWRQHELVEIVHNESELFILKENQSVLLICLIVTGLTLMAIGFFYA